MNMLSFLFAGCLLALVVLYYVLPVRARTGLLLAASLAFGMAGQPACLAVLLAQVLITYTLGRAVGACTEPRRRRLLAGTAVALTIGLLVLVKYAAFGASLATVLASRVGFSLDLSPVDLLLPLGVSFYTLQALGYVLDVAAGRLPAERDLRRYALFVSFFPQLAAGPIGRAPHLLPQHASAHVFNPDGIVCGLKQIGWGLFKKLVVADRLAVYVDAVYAHPDAYGATTLALATYAFAFQIYCDFSGYSDLAIGTARLFGYRLPENFRRPYFADSLGDFWHRWHCSLSTWFRDYVYLPLGGSRVSAARWAFNIAIVFAVSGLWHGASPTYVVWGLLHAAAFIGWRLVAGGFTRVGLGGGAGNGAGWRLLRGLATFHVVCLAWVAFRAPSLESARCIWGRLFSAAPGPLYTGASQVEAALAVALVFLVLVVEAAQARGWCADASRPGRCPPWLKWAGYGSLIIGLMLFSVGNRAFVYHQF